MMKVLDPVKAELEDIRILEQTVPPHMMVLMLIECGKQGIEARSDVVQQLNNAAAAPLARLDVARISRLAKRTDEIANQLLRKMSPDDPRDGLYCSAMFVLSLIDGGFWDDARNQAVLVSLLLMEDLKDERKDAEGNEPLWQMDEVRWRKTAGDLIVAAHLSGLYLSVRSECNRLQ